MSQRETLAYLPLSWEERRIENYNSLFVAVSTARPADDMGHALEYRIRPNLVCNQIVWSLWDTSSMLLLSEDYSRRFDSPEDAKALCEKRNRLLWQARRNEEMNS